MFFYISHVQKKWLPIFLWGVFTLLHTATTNAQTVVELNSGWKFKAISTVNATGEALSVSSYDISAWKNAVVPGTVLTSMLKNGDIPDPFYGMNNERIKDIYNTGRDYYTYWFAKDIDIKTRKKDEQVYLNFRGVNYSCDVYFNGNKLNKLTHRGMFLRQSYNVTRYLAKHNKNRLAVIVYPPDNPGNPNGGQGGDGRIAKDVGTQYTAGWDWIQPIRDRNTGIWDKVTLETTGPVRIINPHVITLVPGQRKPGGNQAPAIIKASAEIQNASSVAVKGSLTFILNGIRVAQKITVAPNAITSISLKDLIVNNPRLWWPNGYGEQFLYPTEFKFTGDDKNVSDVKRVAVGIRKIQHQFNIETHSQQIAVNGQRIFVKGGNWIISDAMLRFSEARYDAEVRFHRDMNLNLIRVWGGALIERPEFYEACDKYGMLVFQDFWISGDANGKWLDPLKADDQWTRRKYPDDHNLFLESAADQIKMVRNHPSLAIWCGGNEITPPQDILLALRDTLIPKLDGTRWFVDFSNSEQMSQHSLGGNGDGPYGIQPLSVFWDTKTYPFNSEIGSVGLGDMASLRRFIPQQNLIAPRYNANGKTDVDSIWNYHKYIGYDAALLPYGNTKTVEDFTAKAQLVNYDQYRGLMEGFSSHMWDWYTGVIIWKTQNPWTALRGQMYDYYLDPNACLYGLKHGAELLHPMYNQTTGMVSVVNNTFNTKRDLMLTATAIDIAGKESLLTQVFVEAQAASTKNYLSLKAPVEALQKKEGIFLCLQLKDKDQKLVSENLYWLADEHGKYSGIEHLAASQLTVKITNVQNGKATVVLTNPKNAPVAFFNRISVIDATTRQRLLPTFYDDNYISLLPGSEKHIDVEYPPGHRAMLSINGWNLTEQQIPIN